MIALRPADAAATTRRMTANLDEVLGDVSGHMIGVYWPFRREPQLLAWMDDVALRGGRCALPVVIEKAAPLVFRAWKSKEALDRGIWNIPVPRHGPDVIPGIVIAPLVGFDPDRYRLGYGGGFYDRTLARLSPRPRVIGIGYAAAAMPTIRPQPHDIRMDTIVTERGIDVFLRDDPDVP